MSYIPTSDGVFAEGAKTVQQWFRGSAAKTRRSAPTHADAYLAALADELNERKAKILDSLPPVGGGVPARGLARLTKLFKPPRGVPTKHSYAALEMAGALIQLEAQKAVAGLRPGQVPFFDQDDIKTKLANYIKSKDGQTRANIAFSRWNDTYNEAISSMETKIEPAAIDSLFDAILPAREDAVFDEDMMASVDGLQLGIINYKNMRTTLAPPAA